MMNTRAHLIFSFKLMNFPLYFLDSQQLGPRTCKDLVLLCPDPPSKEAGVARCLGRVAYMV